MAQPGGHCSITCVTTNHGKAPAAMLVRPCSRTLRLDTLKERQTHPPGFCARRPGPSSVRVGTPTSRSLMAGPAGSLCGQAASARCPTRPDSPAYMPGHAPPHHIRVADTKKFGAPPAAPRSNKCTVSNPPRPDPPGTDGWASPGCRDTLMDGARSSRDPPWEH